MDAMRVSADIKQAYDDICDGWKARAIATREDLAAALNEQRVYFAYNSSKIENPDITYHDTREIFENGKAVSFTGDVRTLFDLQ